MRLFALKRSDDRDGSVLAVLSCFGPPANRAYYIDMPEGCDPWTVPLVLSSFADRGRWAVGPEWSRRWVESRLVPPSRQNIGEVLAANGLDSYDTLALLQMTEGRNSQGDCYLEPIPAADAPPWFAERERFRVAEAVALEGRRLLVSFREGPSRVYSPDELRSMGSGTERALSGDETSVRVGATPGGRGVQWGSSAYIGDDELRRAGEAVPASWNDLAAIAPRSSSMPRRRPAYWAAPVRT